jgi:hypothetical protein
MSFDLTICLACGEDMEPALVTACSIRCHDCRSSKAPVDGELLERARLMEGATIVAIPPRRPRPTQLAA